MTTLLEALNKGTTITPFGGSPGVGATSQVADLLHAKTGRDLSAGLGAGFGGTPRMSTLGEESAVAQSRAQLGQLAQQAQLQQADTQAKMGAVTTEGQAQQANLSAARLDSMQQKADQTANLIQEYKQSRGQLSADQEKALAEQIGFSARLSSEQYVDQLERAGAESRLQDKLGFQEATAREVFGEEAKLFADQFQFNELLNARQNEWNEWLGQIDINSSLAIAAGRATAANQQALWTGIGGAATAGAQGYSAYKNTPATTPAPAQEGDSDFRGPTKGEQTGYGHEWG